MMAERDCAELGQHAPCHYDDSKDIIGHEVSNPSEVVSRPSIASVKEEDSIKKPEVGMSFDTFDEVFSFYRRYADKKGFGLMKQNGCYNENKEMQRVTIACLKSGAPRKTPHYAGYFQKLSAKTGCPARMRVRRLAHGKYIIGNYVDDHNHDLLEMDMMQYLPSNRRTPSTNKPRLKTNDRARLGLAKTMTSCTTDMGGLENVPFTEEDVRNILGKVRVLKLRSGDMEAIQKYFLRMQSKNSNFFYMLDLDPLGRLKNVFWADARSRAAHKYFGDVVSFDTSHSINENGMPFASFFGVNRHGQYVLMGCGLVSAQTVENYTWLFSMWLSCMGRAPDAIITDQAQPIMNAVATVFPNARHRLCLWHIMNKLPHIFGPNEKAMDNVKDVVYESLTIEEFERNWAEMIQNYGLHDNNWLNAMYNLRNMWIPAYVKDCFWAGMSVMQQTDSISAFFDGYINSKTTLKQFVEQYEMILQSKYEKEAQADFDTFNKKAELQTTFSIEEQLSSVYTTGILRKCQEELFGIIYCDLRRVDIEGSDQRFDVSEMVRLKHLDPPKIIKKHFSVLFDEEQKKVCCNCRMFEYRGLLCRHALVVLRNRGVDEIPEKYIKDRWRKDLKRIHVGPKAAMIRISDDPLARYEDVLRRCVEFAEAAAVSKKQFSKVIEVLSNALNEISTCSSDDERNFHQQSNMKSSSGSCGQVGFTNTLPLCGDPPLVHLPSPPASEKLGICNNLFYMDDTERKRKRMQSSIDEED